MQREFEYLVNLRAETCTQMDSTSADPLVSNILCFGTVTRCYPLCPSVSLLFSVCLLLSVPGIQSRSLSQVPPWSTTGASVCIVTFSQPHGPPNNGTATLVISMFTTY